MSHNDERDLSPVRRANFCLGSFSLCLRTDSERRTDVSKKAARGKPLRACSQGCPIPRTQVQLWLLVDATRQKGQNQDSLSHKATEGFVKRGSLGEQTHMSGTVISRTPPRAAELLQRTETMLHGRAAERKGVAALTCHCAKHVVRPKSRSAASWRPRGARRRRPTQGSHGRKDGGGPRPDRQSRKPPPTAWRPRAWR